MGKNLLLAAILVGGLTAGFVGCGESSQSGDAAPINVDDNNPVMNKAIEDARATVDQFIAAFESPSPTQMGWSVKVPIKDGEATEHMWVSSIAYSNGEFSGKINNEPADVSTVKFGDSVVVPSNEISDWMYLDAGKMIGGYTIRAMIELTPADELPEFPFIIE